MRWNLRNKLLASFGIVVLLLILQLTIGTSNCVIMRKSIDESWKKGHYGILLANKINLDVVQVQQWLTDISATRGAEGFDDGFGEAETNAEEFRKDVSELKSLNLKRSLSFVIYFCNFFCISQPNSPSAIKISRRIHSIFPKRFRETSH